MKRGELYKLEELFEMAYTNKYYCDAEVNGINRGLDDICGVTVDTGFGVYDLSLELLDKALLKELLLRYVETLNRKKAEAVVAFDNINVEFPEGFESKFGKPNDMPNTF